MLFKAHLQPVLRIRDILLRIRMQIQEAQKHTDPTVINIILQR
jgi:hypothetical protein